MAPAFYNWVKDSLDHKSSRKDGAIIAADYDTKELSRLTFTQALITEVGLPALDASSRDAAKMTVTFKPETTRFTAKATGKVSYAIDAKKQKQWLPANFRLQIDGLDKATVRVNKIEALVIKQRVTENAVGELRDHELEATSVEIPNLVITLGESYGEPLYSWHEDFVIKGNNGQGSEKGGTLEYLTPDLKTVLSTLTFRNLGIFKVAPDKMESGSEQVRRIKAEMYVEDIRFEPRITK